MGWLSRAALRGAFPVSVGAIGGGANAGMLTDGDPAAILAGAGMGALNGASMASIFKNQGISTALAGGMGYGAGQFGKLVSQIIAEIKSRNPSVSDADAQAAAEQIAARMSRGAV